MGQTQKFWKYEVEMHTSNVHSSTELPNKCAPSNVKSNGLNQAHAV